MKKIIFAGLVISFIFILGCTENIEAEKQQYEEIFEEKHEIIEEENIAMEIKPDLSNNLSALRRELEIINKDKLNIGPSHRERIENDLENLEKEGYDVDELREMLYVKEDKKEQKESGCREKRITFEYPPVNLEKLTFITPLGQMSGSHVTPVDHQYYDGEGKVEVYSPADGTITFVQHMTSSVSDPGQERFVDDYVMTIKHTCTIESHFIHVDNPIKEIVDAVGDEDYKFIYLDVKAGQIIGTYEGTVDYNVFDSEIVNNFANPASYKGTQYSEVKDPFDYFNDEIRNELRSKSLRSVEPVGGEIDYDIDGKLIGTWFEENTNGHQGINQERYWEGHLSFAYNHIDPDLIMISIGTFEERSRQFAVRGNSPDPADVGVNSGLVKYELVDWDYFHDGRHWDRKTLVKPLEAKESLDFYGIVLVEMLEDGRLRFEAFPDQILVDDFTDDAKYFVR